VIRVHASLSLRRLCGPALALAKAHLPGAPHRNAPPARRREQATWARRGAHHGLGVRVGRRWPGAQRSLVGGRLEAWSIRSEPRTFWKRSTGPSRRTVVRRDRGSRSAQARRGPLQGQPGQYRRLAHSQEPGESKPMRGSGALDAW